MTGAPRILFEIRPGSSLGFYAPEGHLEGIIEVNPDHPPIIHWMDGRHEEVKLGPTGEVIINRTARDCMFALNLGEEEE